MIGAVTLVITDDLRAELVDAAGQEVETAGVLFASLVTSADGGRRLLATGMRWCTPGSYAERHKQAKGYSLNRSRIRAWSSLGPEFTTHGRRASSRRGSVRMRTAWTTWSGCAGRAGLPARPAVMLAGGGWPTAGWSAVAAPGGPR